MNNESSGSKSRALIPHKLTLPSKGKPPGGVIAWNASGSVLHVSKNDVARAARTASEIALKGGRRGRGNAERDELLILVLFDATLRISEALGLHPCDLIREEGGNHLRVVGKGRKRGVVSLSRSLALRLIDYAYRKKVAPDRLFFPITRARAHQIVSRAYKAAGVVKPTGVGTLHVLRHSGAIERLRETGNPRAVQDQLRHTSPTMTLRYLKTLTSEESLRIQDQVDFGW